MSDESGKKPRRRAPRSLPYSDIDLSRWKEYPEISTDSLWDVPSRSRDGGHSLDYWGNFVPQIATQVFQRYTRKGDVVLDMFLGSGTSAIEAANQGRRLVGMEINPEMAERVRAKLAEGGSDAENIRVIRGDSSGPEARELVLRELAEMGEQAAHLLVLHPPYHDIIRFTDMAGDLSNADSTESFLEGFSRVAQTGYGLLHGGRFAALVIGDKYEKGELVPLGFLCMQEMNRAGFRTKSIIVKNMAGNERGKGKNGPLWRYRALAGGFYIFKHEYVMIFQKPGRTAEAGSEADAGE